MDKEKLTTYSLALIGAVQGIVRYYVLPAVGLERKPEYPHIGYLTNAEIDLQLGVESGADS